jgi:hypothetical protein
MGFGMRHTINQRIILRRIQKRKSFMMNQTTPHLGAESSLINNESSNRRGQPKMGIVLAFEWKASTQMSQCIERTKKALECKQRHPMTMDHQRGGDLYFKSGKDACMPSNLKALHILVIVTGRSSMKSNKIVDKERIIELMISKNRFRSWNEKRIR